MSPAPDDLQALIETLQALTAREFNGGLQLIYDQDLTVWLGDSLDTAWAVRTFRWREAAQAATWLRDQAAAFGLTSPPRGSTSETADR